jgi:DNA modification methylase
MIIKSLQSLAVPIDTLKGLPGNPRVGDVDAVAKSLDRFGQRKPIVVRQDDGTIIAGNHTWQAAKQLGWTEIAVAYVGDDDVTASAYALADNRTAELGSYDEQALKDLIDQVAAVSPEMVRDAGWADEAVAELVAKIASEQPPAELNEDVIPEVPEVPVAKLGDIWQLGNHRLMCGDSTDLEVVGKLMNGIKADLVFTDPPYGVEYQSNMRTKTEKFAVLSNDDKFLDIAPTIKEYSNGWVFVWTSWKVQNKWIDLLKDFDYPTNIIVWHKPGGGIGDLKRTFSSDYEIALVWHRGAELCGKRIGSVWTINKDGASTYLHPTQKPVELSREALDKTTNTNANVLDLFGGSGSTLIAAEQTNRICYMMELDPKYCDVIVKRWETLTGQKAVLVNA